MSYQGWTNYPIWCVHLWITNDEESYKYWTAITDKLVRHHKHPAPYLRDGLQDQITGAMPEVKGIWEDLLQHTLEEVNWGEIAEALLEESND